MANLVQIEKHLKSKKLPYKTVDLGGEVFTVEGVSKTGVNKDEIVKTLIVKTNNNLIALVVRGRDRVDFKKVRRLFGGKSELAKSDEVLKVTKVPVGAVCPILLNVPLIFDQHVMKLKRVSIGSGDLTKELEMDFADFLKAVGENQVEDLV